MKYLLTIALLVMANCHIDAQVDGYLQKLPAYVENLSVFGEGQEEGRAFHIPEKSMSLNGTWKFLYCECPADVPEDFFRSSFNDRKWTTIPVPSNWEMHGFGQALFRNVSAPFAINRPQRGDEATSPQVDKASSRQGFKSTRQRVDECRANAKAGQFAVTLPEVPMDINPTGAYRTSFNVPASWSGNQVFLRFEKVASASFVWVNGQQVGYNEGAQEPSEYNITKYIKPGKNTLSVLVLKYSDGYYLEGQDYWRLAGIFDDVTLFAAPDSRIRDYQVITNFDDTFTDSQVDLSVDLCAYNNAKAGLTLKAVIEKDGCVVATMSHDAIHIEKGGNSTVQMHANVVSPKKWTAETPELYTLTMTLSDADGKVVDRMVKRMGFKKTEIRQGVFYLNGQPIKVNAQCSHMQHPLLGHAMDEQTIRRDMEILKQFGFNAVRTSHYPPVNEYLDLADEYGLYIIDETGDEAHATEWVSGMPEFIPMYQERVRQMVLRDRNHACVLFWSAGNESGEGPNIAEVIKEGRKYDPTRFWMYGGNAPKHPAEDIVGPRYPTPIEHEMSYGLDQDDLRPSFMDEYLSVAGNGGGALDDFWRVIYSHPKLVGGAIWDFVSPGLLQPVRTIPDKSPNAVMANIMGNAKLVKGKTGLAVDLAKSEQWIQVYRSNSVEISGNKLTLTLDILPRFYNRSGGYMITKGNNQYGIRQIGADKIEFYIDNGKRLALTGSLPADWEGRWHNVCAVYDAQNMTIYIDGKAIASQPASGNLRNLPLSVCIGRNEERNGQDITEYLADALIDNVGIFADAITPDMGYDPQKAALWLDFEKETDQGTFYTYGAGARTYGSIWPDRSVQPEMYQMKKSTQPLCFTLLDPRTGSLEIRNRSYFLNASVYDTRWMLTADDEVVASGNLDVDVEPTATKAFRIPYTKPAIQPGKEYRLTVSSHLRNDELWAKAGHEVAWEQFELSDWNMPAQVPAKPEGTVSLEQTSSAIIASGNGFRYEFDAKHGMLSQIMVDGKNLLTQPLRLNVWRAPVANEVDGWNAYSSRAAFQNNKGGYGAIGHNNTLASMYYSAGLDHVGFQPLTVSARQVDGSVIVDVRELALFGSAREQQLDAYIFGRTNVGMENIYTYRIDADGTITIRHIINPQGEMPAWLPRVGVTLSLDATLNQVEWYGRGPQASYPDRKSGYRIGIYKESVEAMYEPYLIPQDYGLRTDNRWVRFTDADGRGLQFRVDTPFAFNAYPFTTDNLTRSVYQYQLQRSGDITVNLDYATSGVGCTARGIFDAYRAYPMGYERTITISINN